MLDTVIVGVDGSRAGQAALRWAARNVGGDVHTVFAISPAIELLEAGFQIDTTGNIDRAREKLDGSWIDEVDLPGDRLFSHVIEDGTPQALIATAHLYDARAIVIGATGRDRIGGLVGANAGHLIHLSDVPLIVVPAGAPDSNDSGGPIVIAISGDSHSDQFLVAWARAFGGHNCAVHLVHCVRPGRPWRTAESNPPTNIDEEATRYMEQLLGEVSPEDRVSVTLDDPLTAIVDASATSPLAVIGSRHSSRVGGFLTGAVAQHLPAVSSCAIAIIPVDEH